MLMLVTLVPEPEEEVHELFLFSLGDIGHPVFLVLGVVVVFNLGNAVAKTHFLFCTP